MPGILYHLTFAEEVYRHIEGKVDKKEFFAGNLIPDIALNKKKTHYRVPSTLKCFEVPNLEEVKKDLLNEIDSIKVGMYCHLYLDYYFIEKFLIPEFEWDEKNMKVRSLNTENEWRIEDFFAQPSKGGILYKGYSEINQLLIKNKNVKQETINMIPEILPNTGMETFDIRRDKKWKEELESYLKEDVVYTGKILDYFRLTYFISIMAKKCGEELNELIKKEKETIL